MLLVAGVAVNVAGFAAADRDAPTNWHALHRYASADLAAIAMADDGPLWQRYGVFEALAQLAPGSSILVPSDGPLSHPNIGAQLYGAGDASNVRQAPHEVVAKIFPQDASTVVDRPSGFDPTPFVVARGPASEDDRTLAWAIALDEPDTRPVDLRDPDGFLAELIASDRSGAARGPARELLLVLWLPDAGAGEVQRLLLVETALLPPELRRELT